MSIFHKTHSKKISIHYGYTLWSKINCDNQNKIINKLENICYQSGKNMCISKIIDLYYNSIEDIKTKLKSSKKKKILISNFIPLSSDLRLTGKAAADGVGGRRR